MRKELKRRKIPSYSTKCITESPRSGQKIQK